MSSKPRVKMPSATSIVARSHPDHVIGVDNKLPWHLRTDLQHFKRRTVGHAIIMGRKTYESIGRPLPKRLSIVLSRAPIEEQPGLKWAPNPETALLLADVYTITNMAKEFFIIGGETIYDVFDIFINRVWLTEVFTGPMNGDAKFDGEFKTSEWWTPYEHDFPQSDVDQYGFRISFYMRKKAYHRDRSKEEFMGHDPDTLRLIDQWEQMIDGQPTVPPIEELQISMFD